MTITAAPSEISYATDGVSVVFAIPFPFDTAADLKLTSTDASGNIVTLTTGFTISGGAGSTGIATFSVVPVTGLTITIYDDPARTQPTDYVSLDAFPAESHERALDRVTRIAKRLYQLVQRSVRFPDGDVSTDGVLGSVANRKGKYLFFNAVTGAIEYAANIITTTLSQSVIAGLLNPQTSAEVTAGVVPTNYAYPAGDTRRYSNLQQAHDALPAAGGTIYLPPGTLSFAGLVITRPVILKGSGAAIGASNVSPTVLSYTGSGIAIDVQDGGGGLGGRGSVLRDFQLVNAGTGTIGIRLNNQDPKLQNVYVYQTTSGYTGFSVAGIRVGDVNQVNDLLLRDLYIRQQPALGIDLWNVSEGTLDHVRLIQNKGFQLKIGDTASGSSCNGLNLVNGTSAQTANTGSSGGGIQVQRSNFKLVMDHIQFETDSVNGTNYAIDLSAATVCDSLIVKNSYFFGASWTAAAAYAIAVNTASANVEVDGCYFINFTTSAVKNTAAGSICFGSQNVLNTCPALVDVFSVAVQQYTGTFTPTVLGSSPAGVTTYTVQNGTFRRDGHLLSFRIRVGWSAQTGGGNLLVGNLPLSSANTENHPISVLADNLTFPNQLAAFVAPNSTLISIYSMSTGASMAAVALDTSAGLWLAGSYFV